jgi:Ni/Co efflux regulator RcnB
MSCLKRYGYGIYQFNGVQTMNSKTALSVILAVMLASGGPAFAQGRGNHDERGNNGQSQRGDDHRDQHDNDGRGPDQRGGNWQGNHDQRHDERGAGPNHDFRRGGYLPAEYRHRQYVVDDWRGHRLSEPPRGYHWVQTGGDYVLVAIASGIILQLLLGR